MIPKIILEETGTKWLFMPLAWYDPEANQIHILDKTQPRWLAVLHELGHWIIGYFPEWIHRRVAIDYWYDHLWSILGLNNKIIVELK